MRTASDRLPRFLSSLVAIGVAKLAEQAPRVPQATASQVMQEVVAELVARFRCAEIYVPADVAGTKARRDALIRHAYAQPGPSGTRPSTAARIRELADQHQISPRRVRAILAVETEELST